MPALCTNCRHVFVSQAGADLAHGNAVACAARAADTALLARLFDLGASWSTEDGEAWPLIHAVQYGTPEIVRILVRNLGAAVPTCQSKSALKGLSEGGSLLHLAAASDNFNSQIGGVATVLIEEAAAALKIDAPSCGCVSGRPRTPTKQLVRGIAVAARGLQNRSAPQDQTAAVYDEE